MNKLYINIAIVMQVFIPSLSMQESAETEVHIDFYKNNSSIKTIDICAQKNRLSNVNLVKGESPKPFLFEIQKYNEQVGKFIDEECVTTKNNDVKILLVDFDGTLASLNISYKNTVYKLIGNIDNYILLSLLNEAKLLLKKDDNKLNQLVKLIVPSHLKIPEKIYKKANLVFSFVDFFYRKVQSKDELVKNYNTRFVPIDINLKNHLQKFKENNFAIFVLSAKPPSDDKWQFLNEEYNNIFTSNDTVKITSSPFLKSMSNNYIYSVKKDKFINLLMNTYGENNVAMGFIDDNTKTIQEVKEGLFQALKERTSSAHSFLWPYPWMAYNMSPIELLTEIETLITTADASLFKAHAEEKKEVFLKNCN